MSHFSFTPYPLILPAIVKARNSNSGFESQKTSKTPKPSKSHSATSSLSEGYQSEHFKPLLLSSFSQSDKVSKF